MKSACVAADDMESIFFLIFVSIPFYPSKTEEKKLGNDGHCQVNLCLTHFSNFETFLYKAGGKISILSIGIVTAWNVRLWARFFFYVFPAVMGILDTHKCNFYFFVFPMASGGGG